MIIDWYTIMFQIVNFLLLVFLLRYFLYGPIIRAMDEREQKIMMREEEAATEKEEAEKEAQDYRIKSEDLQQQEEEIREKARAAAEKEKLELLDKARREVDETRGRWEEAFEREKETFISELRRRVGQQSCSVARRCLQDLADARLEELTWNLFLKKIGDLPVEELLALQKAITAGDKKVSLRSAFDPPEEKISELKKNLKKIMVDSDSAINLSVKTAPDLICGLELDSGGYRVAWNIDSYLEDIEEQILKEIGLSTPAKQAEEVSGGVKPES